MSRIREWMGDRRVAAALVVFAVLSVGYRFLSARRDPAAPAPQGVAVPSPVPVPPQAPSPPAIPSPPRPAPSGGSGPAWAWDRNPFLPAGPESGSGKDGGGAAAGADGEGVVPEEKLPELRGTVVSGGAGMAIFGDRLVPAGEKIGEWTLVKVEPYKVSLRRGRETRVLEIYRQ